MLPFIVGVVVVGAIGYGIKKLYDDEVLRDDVFDKVTETIEAGLDRMIWGKDKKVTLSNSSIEIEINMSEFKLPFQ